MHNQLLGITNNDPYSRSDHRPADNDPIQLFSILISFTERDPFPVYINAPVHNIGM